MELPRPLQPWSEYLELFPRELGLALGPWVRLMDRLIGPLRVQGQSGEGTPDGYAGLTRRGDYERLLISEWLLADEIPEEFARRAAMKEQAFLELARQATASTRVSVALLDAGPNQIGTPRIAHLAALIVLARRATASKATFLWGTLQHPMEPLHEGVTPQTVLKMLAARVPQEAQEVDVAVWRQRIGSEVGADDLWLIGGKRLGNLPSIQGAAHLQITDPLETEANHLLVTVVERGRTKPEICLELPESGVCAHLLRDPFHAKHSEIKSPLQRYAAPTSPLIFTGHGNRLLGRLGVNQVIFYTLPSSHIPFTTLNVARPKIYAAPNQRPILAAAQIGRGILLVTMTHETNVLEVERVGPQGGRFPLGKFSLPPDWEVSPPRPTDPLGLCYYQAESTGSPRLFVQLNNRLLGLSQDDQSRIQDKVFSLQNPCIASGATYSGYALLGEEQYTCVASGATYSGYVLLGEEQKDGWTWLIVKSDGPRIIHRRFPRVDRAFFGYGSHLEGEAGLLAVQEEPGQWSIYVEKEHFVLTPPTDVTVIGATYLLERSLLDGYQGQLGLVVLESDRRQISFYSRTGLQKLTRASSEITQITVSTYEAALVYLTEQGELIAYNLANENVYYRLETESKR